MTASLPQSPLTFTLPSSASWILQQPLPLDGLREDLSLQPHLVAIVEVLGQVHALAQHALQAVVHRGKVAVLILVVATAVELLDALSEGALLCLEVPGPCVNIWEERRMESRGEGIFKSMSRALILIYT